MSQPSVSVIVCTRDRPRDVRVALPAILASRWRAFELVVVDQSQTDETEHIVAAFARHDGRVRHVRDRGIGLSRARIVRGEQMSWHESSSRVRIS